jgi:two-component system, chemotaxis family, sensor kinase CheA
VSQLTSELQERVMKTRMQPINSVWGKLPRIVRDLALQCHKRVRVEMEGQDTELDRTIIEAIKDPMTHLVRNSVDHGIESPDVRDANGKDPEGRLLLRAFHEGGKVVIEIVDDGAGIDPAKIKAKAIEKGVITPEYAENMSDGEAINLIFAAGFSTAEQVSNISGRGVGMDVVKTNIERIGGSLDVRSQVGEGTTLVIRIPLTLAIVPALIVTSGGARFAIPQPNLVELVRVREDSDLETIEGARFHRLRGRLLPALDLNELLELRAPAVLEDGTKAARSLAVLQVDGRQFGLLVDRVNDAEEIVVKPLGQHLKGHPVFAGCTIMGDGSVALILDAMSIARRAGIGATHIDEVALDAAIEDTESLLLCRCGDVRVAVPLSQVARLEHVEATSIEVAGNQTVLKYGRTLLPVVQLASYVGAGYAAAGQRGEDSAEKMKMIVTSEANGRSIGLIVDAIEDSVSVSLDALTLQGGASRFGVVGTAVVRDQVTDVVDIEAICGSVDGSFFAAERLAVSAAAEAYATV